MIRDADIKRKTQTKGVSDFLRRVMPEKANSNRALACPGPELSKELIVPKVQVSTPLLKIIKKTRSPSPIPPTSKEILCETPKQGSIPGIGDNDVTE